MRPLSGVRVVEFGQILAGPFCGCLLADMGADVIKIEPPDGDPMRNWAPIVEGYSQYFSALNRNKRSITLNLKDEEERATARKLALGADIVIENYRPGVLARLGLDFDALQAENPALVYCSISAFGQTGPRATEGGFDITIQAMSGVMSVTGERDGRPVKCGVPIADSTAGLYAAFTATAALWRARQSGLGEHIDMAMLGGMLGIAHLQTSELFGLGRDPVRLGSAHPTNAPYAAFRCQDGYIALAAGTDKLWGATCAAIGRGDLAEDPRFASPTLRGENQEILREILESNFGAHDANDLLHRLNANGVPCAPLYTYAEVVADAQVEHMGWVGPLTLPNGVRTQTILPPQRMSGKHLGILRPPPALGEHTAEILASLRPGSRSSGASRFRRFLRAFTMLVERGDETEDEILDSGSTLLADLVGEDDWLPEGAAQAHPDRYQQYLLYCDPLERFSVVSFVWGPGQQTPIHDHTVWGLIGMLRGAEESQRYSRVPGLVGLMRGRSSRLDPGQVDRVSPTIGDLHAVSNAYPDRVSISIHIYGTNIGCVRRHAYDPETGAAKPFVSGYSSAHLPNFWDRSHAP